MVNLHSYDLSKKELKSRNSSETQAALAALGCARHEAAELGHGRRGKGFELPNPRVPQHFVSTPASQTLNGSHIYIYI